MAYIPTENHLRQILATILAGATSRTETYWNGKIGTIRPVPPTTDPRSNWRLTDSTGTAADTQAIEKAVALVQAEHPYVSW
jgi:hypothetical protein